MGADQSVLSEIPYKRSSANFFINGNEYNVSADTENVGSESLLVDYIRDHAGLKGTKYMCREGGCGACVVAVKTRNPNSGEDIIRAVNSCLMPVLSCDGWDITTIEHLGSIRTSLHPIQQRMVDFSGTQCGYCTPGWIMNMYGLMESTKNLTAKDVEDSMDGNICRCTGYRPIFDAMKSLAPDAPEELKRKCGVTNNACSGCPCDTTTTTDNDEVEYAEEAKETELVKGEFEFSYQESPLHLNLKSGEQWVKATDLNSLFMALQRFQTAGLKYRLVAGNTGTGVYKNDGPYEAYIDLNSIPVLTKINLNSATVTLGGAVTLSSVIAAMTKASELSGYAYCKDIVKHWKRVANTPVRNAATLAGNLMLKHAHREFPSDIFIVLETIGATLNIASAPSLQKMCTVQEFLNTNMTGKIIHSISFPRRKGYYFRSFKITRRYQNAHAYVNAGFLMQVDPKRKFSVRDKPTIVFGGISPNFIHAVGTEIYFVGKFLEEKTIQGAMAVLDKELQPDARPPDAEPMYRKALAQSLLYKFLLGIMGDATSTKIRSGSLDIERGLNYGKQAFDTDKSQWPLYQPIHKCCRDPLDDETSDESKLPGVITFLEAKDIPGTNNFMVTVDQASPDLIFVEDKITYAGQPVGVVVAETRDIAMKAAKLVTVTYKNVQQPTLDIQTALIKAEKENRLDDCIIKVKPGSQSKLGAAFRRLKGIRSGLEHLVLNNADDEKLDDSIRIIESPRKNLEDAPHTLKGEFRVGSQYHFQMEPQVCVCIPREDGMDIFAASQWIQQLQSAVASCLGWPNHVINVQVRRVGGGFGSKIARSALMVTACALAAYKTNRPVRMVLDLETNMATLGKRLPYLFPYEVGFDDSGKISNLTCKIICDTGCTSNEPTAFFALLCMQSCYSADGWQLAPGQVNTNTPPNTYCRAPGSPQAIGCIEHIMDHIAFYLNKDSMDVRLVNLLQKGDQIFGGQGKVLEEDNAIPTLLEEIKTSADLDDRVKFVETFNKSNRWKKRGLALTPMRCAVHYLFSGYNIFLSVYSKDGTVSLAHSGVEMGQGINTKVAQVVAKELQIPVDKVRVKPSNVFIGANTSLTGAAITSEHICYAAVKACGILNDRIATIKRKLDNPSWELLVGECAKVGMDLTSYYNTTYNDHLRDYAVWGLTACEVEIDCLTGEYKLVRIDIINDAGQSLSPEVDMGQVEGAFTFGLGMWLTEKIQHDANTGELLTNRTWEYKPPASKDIPEDFRVTLMRNASNPNGILRSKATGEAPLCMSVSALLAIKKAIAAARKDAGNINWFTLDGPVTPEDIHRLCLTDPKEFSI